METDKIKVIFLDFDGVLNSEKFVRSCEYCGVMLDPSRMILLKQIIDATGAKIVLSTSWRMHWDKDECLCNNVGLDINRIFGEYQLKIFDKTPKLYDRVTEIKVWLENHPQTQAFAVLDDAFLNADFLNEHFVRTSNLRNGLDEDDVKKAINILNGEINDT